MKRLLFIILLLSSSALAQPWSGILAPMRATDWTQTGISGGIPVRSTICATIPVGASAATIQTAANACAPGGVILLSAGAYSLSTSVFANKGIVFRGAGPTSTTVTCSTGSCFYIGLNGTGGQGSTFPTSVFTEHSWTGGLTAGSTVLTLNSTTGIHAGQNIDIDELNPAWVYTNGVEGNCLTGNSCGRNSNGIQFFGDASRAAPQMVHVVSVDSGTQITIAAPGVGFTHLVSLIPQTFSWTCNGSCSGGNPNSFGGNVQFGGVENMKINANNNDFAISMPYCDYCWVKNVEIDNIARAGVFIWWSLGDVVRDSYISSTAAGAPTQYGIEVMASSQVLIENNICYNVTACLLPESNYGLVVGYNYAFNAVAGNLFASFSTHLSHNYLSLDEGNVLDFRNYDNSWGSASHETMFRNRSNGTGKNKTNFRTPVGIGSQQHYENLVANVLGDPTLHIQYECTQATPDGSDNYIYTLGWWNGCGNTPFDTTTESSLMRWGNWDAVTYCTNGGHSGTACGSTGSNGIRLCTAAGVGNAACTASETASTDPSFPGLVSPSSSFPASFYNGVTTTHASCGTGLGFWKNPLNGSCPIYPPIGPDVTCTTNCVTNTSSHVAMIPAQLCYNNTSKNVSGYLTAFDASNCYTADPTSSTGSFASVNPTSLNFNLQIISTTSSGQVITLSNTGGSTLNIASTGVTGDYARNTTCGATLAAGASCTITVTFTPTTYGTRLGILTVTDDSGGVGGSTQTVSLNGTGVAVGGPLTYAARTDNCVKGAESGCVGGSATGQTGATLVFQEGPSDPIPAGYAATTINSGSCPSGLTPSSYPAYCPAPMNTTAIDSDFSSYAVLASDDSIHINATPWINSWSVGDAGPDVFSQDETLLLLGNNFGNFTLVNIDPVSIHAQTCGSSVCVNETGIYSNSVGDTTHLVAASGISASRIPTEAKVFYEANDLLVSKITVTSSISTPGTGTLARATYVDFKSNTPINCSVMPPIVVGANTSNYHVNWQSGFHVANDGSIGYGLAGGYDWLPSWTPADVLGNTIFIVPLSSNPNKHGYQATTLGATGATEPVWNGAGCTSYVTGATCSDNAAVWTDIGNVGGQGPGFDVVSYKPGLGCSRVNTRLAKIYRGVGNTAPGGHITTNDPIACTRTNGAPCAAGVTVNLPDEYTLHEVAQVMDGTFLSLSATGGEALNPPGNWNSGTLTCQPNGSGDVWAGAWNSGKTYTIRQAVSYTDGTSAYYVATSAASNVNKIPRTGGVVNTAYWTQQEAYCPHYYWNVATTQVAPTTAWGSTGGHQASGYLYRYYGGKRTAGRMDVPSLQLAPPNGPITGNPGTNLLTDTLPSDDHGTYLNDGAFDLQPPFATLYDPLGGSSARYTKACYDEVCAFANIVTGATARTYRFGHNFNTNRSQFFSVSQNIGVISPQGDLFAFPTDMYGTRGSIAAGSTQCNNGAIGSNNCRGDVLIIDLLSAHPATAGPPPPGTTIAPSSLFTSNSTIQ